MRSQADVDKFKQEERDRIISADGDPDHGEAASRARERLALYEACVPEEFWEFTEDRVKFNVNVFNDVVLPYCEKWRTAITHGYGLCFLGSNGVGKTLFISWVLRHALRTRKLNAYYTTAPQLDYDIRAGWNNHAKQDRLEEFLQSDWLAIDELGKEQVNRHGENEVVRGHIERVLKMRSDNCLPTLLATNMDLAQLEKTFGESVMSLLDGKYECVVMAPGDFRKSLADERKKRMGSRQ